MSKSGTRHNQANRAGRRNFLRFGAMLSTSLLAMPALGRQHLSRERTLTLTNTHTDESISTVYWADGDYLEPELDAINNVLRDHRTGDVFPVDTSLLDLLFVLGRQVGARQPFQVISGYRSPATNAALAAASSGVAKKSYHIQGKAIDIRLPGCSLEQLHKAALSISAGGVGYYPSSDFIHVDVGPVRSW